MVHVHSASHRTGYIGHVFITSLVHVASSSSVLPEWLLLAYLNYHAYILFEHSFASKAHIPVSTFLH